MALGNLYRKPFTCNVCQKNFMGIQDQFYGRAGYVDDPLPNIVFGCLLALYGSTMHPARLCGGFRTTFFCLVCGPLEKKKEKLYLIVILI